MSNGGHGPLAGVRVLDVTHVMAGSWCGCLLAQMGADVVKVEPTGRGEELRHTQGQTRGAFRPFDAVNYGKRSLAIDLGDERGVEALRRLASHAGVFVENYRPGALDRRGLGYEALAALNPGLVYASISAFGATGPGSERPGFDLVAQAMSGVLSVTGQTGEDPVSAGVPVADMTAGTLAALGVLSAWIHRLNTGQGQRVETSLFEAALSLTIWESALWFDLGQVAKPNGARHRLATPYGSFPTADGLIVIAAGTQANWQRLVGVLGTSEITTNDDFASPLLRLKHREALEAQLADVFRKHPTDHWLARLEQAGVPCGPVLGVDGAWRDPQTEARGMSVAGEPEGDGRPLRVIGPAVKLSETAWRSRPEAPELGADSTDVLTESGFDPNEIDALVRAGVIGGTRSD